MLKIHDTLKIVQTDIIQHQLMLINVPLETITAILPLATLLNVTRQTQRPQQPTFILYAFNHPC